jgi:hypothetical protein
MTEIASDVAPMNARPRHVACSVVAAALALSPGAALASEQVTLFPDRDNTLINVADGSLSYALSELVFAGRIGSKGPAAKLRRGLMRFDVASAVPAGATVLSVQLDVHCVMTSSGNQTVTLRRLLEDWGEGTSFSPGGGGAPATPGDATWLHRFWPDTLWTVAGGTFAPTVSASTVMGVTGPYSWSSTAAMVADVQGWIDAPESNFGWIIRGNESTPQSVKGIGSRENQVRSQRPMLTIEYEPRPAPSPDLDGDGMVDGVDLGLLLASWVVCPPTCSADLNEDGVVDAADLGILLAAWSE